MAQPAPHTSAPDFRHVSTWVFDLDNTLYPAQSQVFPQIDRRMTEFVARRFDLSAEAARALQKSYYAAHGTTLSGLIARHGIDPHDYLSYVHDIDLSVLAPDPALRAGLSRLPGRRLVFTNGSTAHAERVLDRLGIGDLFEAVFDIIAAAYVPKPAPETFSSFVARHGIAPRQAAMFEDIARNLVPAHGLGMTTVWLRSDTSWGPRGTAHPEAEPHHIHHETGDLPAFLAGIAVAEAP